AGNSCQSPVSLANDEREGRAAGTVHHHRQIHHDAAEALRQEEGNLRLSVGGGTSICTAIGLAATLPLFSRRIGVPAGKLAGMKKLTCPGNTPLGCSVMSRSPNVTCTVDGELARLTP